MASLSVPFSPLASRGSALRSVGLSPHIRPPSPYRLHDDAAAHRLASPVADLLAQRWASVVIRLGPDAFNDWADRALPELVATGGAFATLRWLLAEGPADY